MSEVIRYDHTWGERIVNVAVFADLRGKHREHCLCFAGCMFFHPGEANNCEIAQTNFENCVRFDVVLPVYECPKYRPMIGVDLDVPSAV